MVSAHLGARPEHHKWQGKFYSRSGRDKRFPDFVASTGYGTVTGLCGANCRHSFGPGDGVNNPYDTYDSEENQKAYDLQQRQRLLERRIRKTKRQVMGLKAAADEATTPELKAGFTLDYEKKSALLSKQNAAYKQFCKENNLKELSDRLAIAKWDRQQAAAARGAAKRYENGRKTIEIPDDSDIIKIEIDELTPCLRRLKDNKIVDTDVFAVKPKKKDFFLYAAVGIFLFSFTWLTSFFSGV